MSASTHVAPPEPAATGGHRRRSGVRRDGSLPTRMRSAAALAVLAALPVLAAVLLVLCAGLTVTAFGTGLLPGVLMTAVTLLPAGVVAEAAAVLRRADALTRREPDPAVLLSRATHRGLWRAVEDISAGMDVVPPDRIFATDTADVALVLRDRNRDLQIGLPLFGTLDSGELAALVAHELGHDIVGHTPLIALTHRVTRRVEAVMAGVTPGLVRTLLSRYLRAFELLAHRGNALQELQADEWAAQLVGPFTMASALRREVTVETAWHVLGEEYLPLIRLAQRRPPLTEGLNALIAARGAELGRDSRRRVVHASPFDAHPPRPTRIEAMVELAGESPERPPTSLTAADLLTGGAGTLAGLERELVPDAPRRPVPPVALPAASWKDVVAMAGRARAERLVRVLTGSAAEAGLARPLTLPVLLQAAAEGTLERLDLPPLDPRIRAERRRDGRLSLLRGYLSALVTVAAIRSGRARHELDWARPADLLRLDEDCRWTPWDPMPTIAQGIATPLAVDALLGWLAHLGIDVTAALDDDTRRSDVRPLGALDRMRYDDDGGTSSAMLLLYTTGLLVVPAPAPQGLMRFVPRRLRRLLPPPSTDRIAEVTALADDDPATCPGTRWIPVDDVESAQITDLRSGLSLQAQLTDRTTFSLASGAHTSRQGNPADDLARLLGARVRAVDSPPGQKDPSHR